jgi:hypothetical protein
MPGELPRTFHGKWGPRVAYPTAVVVLVGIVALAIALPGGERGYRLIDRVLIVVTGLAIAWVLHRLGAVRIVCTAQGVTVVNLIRRQQFEWAEIVGVRLEQSAPWLVLDISDGTSVPAMGIQGSDGSYAQWQATELARLVAQQTRTPRDD